MTGGTGGKTTFVLGLVVVREAVQLGLENSTVTTHGGLP